MEQDRQAPKDTTRPSTSGALSRRARALQNRTGVRDTTKARVDSLALETLKAEVRDSSARLAQFQHVRHDVPHVLPVRPSGHPLYLNEPTMIKNQDVLDSARMVYRLRRNIGGLDTKIPIDVPFDEYRNIRLRRTLRANWELLAHQHELVDEKKKGLSDVFGQITKIEIPVPKNPLFSIFGENRIRIQINGSVDIHGAFTNTKSDLQTPNPLDQVRNEPNFDQQVRVGVKGEIGDKLKIDADWDTERTFEYENQLRVKYTGYEDEIVQSVEAGNVSLPTNTFFIPSSQALFGIKSAFQFGPLRLTTVASQKRGQIKELSVSGGSRPTPFERKAHEYSKDHYFLDLPYRRVYEEAFKQRPLVVDPALHIEDIEIWVSRVGQPQPGIDRDGVAFVYKDTLIRYQDNPQFRTFDFPQDGYTVVAGSFIKLQQEVDYTLEPFLGYISLKRSLQQDQIIAAAYRLPTEEIGTFGSKDTGRLFLKLVRPRNLQPNMKPAWDLMLKNIYPLGGTGIKKDGFKLELEYRLLSSGKPVTAVNPIVPGKPAKEIDLLQMFGLDRYDEDGKPQSDSKFDFDPPFTINPTRGELVFPSLEPFSKTIRNYFLSVYTPQNSPDTAVVLAAADSFTIHEVYDTTYNGAANSPKNNFYIVGTTTSAIASTYPLGFNIVEGSVEVLVNGQKQTPNVDYTVDYLAGVVTIKNQSLLVPGANLQIKYEANDLFQLASKSLLGARGELAVAKNTALGFTIMKLNQQTLSDKVRLGEEPISNTIMGIDGATSFDMDFLTRAINWLPGIRTTAPSSLALKGEAAYMLPDPNTRKSNISQDASKSIAFIDDFEGARRTIPLGSSYAGWRDASPPAYIAGLDAAQPVNGRIDLGNPAVRQLLRADTSKMEFKAKLAWYSVEPSNVFVRDIWPTRQTRPGEDFVTVLSLYYKASKRGTNNTALSLRDSLFAQPEKGWAGVMRPLGTTATNLLDENVTFLELWVNVERTSPTAKLNLNLGSITEDVIPNGRLNTEDGLGGTIRTGVINDPTKQDVGLDEMGDDEERAKFAAFISAYPEYAADPSGDDYVGPGDRRSSNPDDYLGFRGTDGNARAGVADGRFPDTEDLNVNDVVDRTNNYFEYEISLDTTSAGFRQFVTGGGANGWYQIRIPIKESTRRIGDPSLSNVESIRLWFTGVNGDALVRITEFNLVGNQWREANKDDKTFRVSNVNVEENPSYSSPPGVPRPVDRTQPDKVIQGNEQSLALQIETLKDGESKLAIKELSTRPLDLFSYKTMKMFVHGDDRPGFTMRYVDTTNYDVEFFFRFGSDSLNYYEYRAPLRPGWDKQNEVSIRFEDLTSIKLARDSARAISRPIPVKGGPEGATYRVLGNPTLTTLRLLYLGVYNPPGKGSTDAQGEVWVNELRLTDVDDTPGWAYRFESNLKVADVLTASVTLSQRDPFFHGLEDRFGSRTTDRNWAISSSLAFERFLPASWLGSTMTLTYSHAEAMQNPRYLPGTDILVEEASSQTESLARESGRGVEDARRAGSEIRQQSRSLSVTETYALPSIRLNLPSSFWLISETVNRMNFGFSFSNSKRRSPSTEFFQQWGWNFRFGYGLQLSPSNYVEPFADLGNFFLFAPWKSLKFFYTPRGVNTGVTLNRGQTHQKERNQLQKRPVARNFNATRNLGFGWQLFDGGFLNPSIDYSVDISSSLVHLEVDRFGHQRSLAQILGDILGGGKLVDFGIDQNYGQSISLNTRLVVPPILKLDRILTPSFRYSTQYSWQNSFQAGDLGKSAGVTSTISAGMDINLKVISDEVWSPRPASAAKPPEDTTGAKKSQRLFERLDDLSRALLKIPFFDWDRLTITLTQTNSSRNGGVRGRPGFLNLFGRVPFVQGSLTEYGPSAAYQLGLASDPHGELIIGTKGSFPFIRGKTIPGLRAPLGNLTDSYSQTNRINLRTSRTLWEGARIDLTWNVGWSHNLTTTLKTDSAGVPTVTSRTVTGDVDRSYLTFPNSFIFKLFKTGVEEVSKGFERLKFNRKDTRKEDVKLVEAFENGMEALPIGKKLLSSLFPRPNWTFRWDGLESIPLFAGFAQRVSLDHAYTSSFRRRFKLTVAGGEVTESENVVYAFSPLVGVNVTFKQVGKGNLTGGFRYGTSTSYDLAASVQTITQTNGTDMTISANYTRTGFEIPFFGLSLSNDLDISFSYSVSKNNRRAYDMKKLFKKDGDPLEGTVRTVMEPRIRYTLSARVQASVYYKYTRFKPDAGGSRIPGSTINEGGLDVRVQIQ